MRLLHAFDEDRQAFEKAGYRVPSYDREALKKKTRENPEWVHFGPGNIFRAYQAQIWEQVLASGASDKGVIVAEAWDYEILDKAFRPYDNLALSVVLHSDGKIEKNVIGCIAESLKCDPSFEEDWAGLREIFAKPSLRVVSFSITEKGYLFPAEDPARGTGARSAMGKLTLLLLERFLAGQYPITLQSMDNCSHNGGHVKRAVEAYADAFVSSGAAPREFADYVRDPDKVSCPWCMIDKITPRPSPLVEALLEKDGYEDRAIIETEKKSYTASFVNSEEVGYLVVEDSYPNGRLPWNLGGAIFTDRETVDKVERMKVGTCLNPLHTALATYGCMMGFTLVQDEMKDPDLLGFITRMADEESMPVVTDPGIISPRAFIDECLTKRFVNAFMPDTPQRIATDNSQAVKIRYSGTVSEYLRRGMDVSRMIYIPLVYAGYVRYLSGLDDNGEPFEISPDPLKDELHGIVKDLKVTEEPQDFSCLRRILTREDVFNMDLYKVGLGQRVEELVKELFAGPGAVRKTLHKYVTR